RLAIDAETIAITKSATEQILLSEQNMPVSTGSDGCEMNMNLLGFLRVSHPTGYSWRWLALAFDESLVRLPEPREIQQDHDQGAHANRPYHDWDSECHRTVLVHDELYLGRPDVPGRVEGLNRLDTLQGVFSAEGW
ncbi:MAG: hypothetical protein MUO94_00330, partial [Thermoplasmata archaeon]|nr:hypothetical protein [Thermoplasmata archaeon]